MMRCSRRCHKKSSFRFALVAVPSRAACCNALLRFAAARRATPRMEIAVALMDNSPTKSVVRHRRRTNLSKPRVVYWGDRGGTNASLRTLHLRREAMRR